MDIANEGRDMVEDDECEVVLRGRSLLDSPLLNKGTAFTWAERKELGLLGLLPPTQETLDEQASRAYEAFRNKTTDLERHIYLRQLQDANEILFYRVLLDHLAEMTPIVYTPTVGLACERFSHIFRRPRGLYLAYPERAQLDAILDDASGSRISVIVVTDGERILGLGDQGVGGMGIPIGKLSLYTACGGVHPGTTLPILLDVGTNNQERLDDPMYVGWRHERIAGREYDAFIETFVKAVERNFPGVLLQWEDFAQAHAGPILERYRDRLCTFNDDIQGTAAVATGALLAAAAASGERLRDQRIAILGAGSAGCGVAEQLVAAMVDEGLELHEARARLFLVDRQGLLHDRLTGLKPFQEHFRQPGERVAGWDLDSDGAIGLHEVVRQARPTILIGVSGQPGMFTEPIVRTMAEQTARPIIFPLSNPTSRAEAIPAKLIEWTEGRALVATGSPFDDVEYAGRRFPIAQCNNSYVFPGLGLGVVAVGASRVSEAMFMAAARALAACSPAATDPNGPLLPALSESRLVARAIALAVAGRAQLDGLAPPCPPERLESLVDRAMWWPRYPKVRFKRG